MTIDEVLREAKNAKSFRRKSWTHGDWIRVKGAITASLGGGELFWHTGERVTLFYFDDLTASDWQIKGETWE